MNLPTHIPQKPIAIPLILEGLSVWELAAYHDYCRRHNMPEKCLEIEGIVNKMSLKDRTTAKKLKYYLPIKSAQ